MFFNLIFSNLFLKCRIVILQCCVIYAMQPHESARGVHISLPLGLPPPLPPPVPSRPSQSTRLSSLRLPTSCPLHTRPCIFVSATSQLAPPSPSLPVSTSLLSLFLKELLLGSAQIR